MSISDMTALELGRRIQSGDITAVQAAEASLARIKAMEPSIHAFVTVNEEKTMEQAGKVQADIEAGRLKGPLAGVPVSAFMPWGLIPAVPYASPAPSAASRASSPPTGPCPDMGLLPMVHPWTR